MSSAGVTLVAAARLQLWDLRARPDAWMVLATTPLAALAVAAIVLGRGRPDLLHLAVVGPGLIATFQFVLFEASEQLAADRALGRLEPMVATPAPILAVVLGRSCVTAAVAMLAVVESVVVVTWVSGGGVHLHHPGTAVVALVVTWVALVGFALPLSSLLLLTRAVRVLQNSLPWPVFLLSGVLVPVAILPEWVQPVSGLIFLTSSATLLRAVLQPAPVEDVAPHVLVVLASAAVLSAAGMGLYRVALGRLRRSGELALG